MDLAVAPLLEVQGLGVSFEASGHRVRVVDDMSFRVDAGKTLAIVGESGAGKTLACRALLGLLPTTASVMGSVRFEGDELIGKPEREYRRLRGNGIAIVFQEPGRSLDPIMSIGGQISETVRAHEERRHVSVRARTLELLRLVQFPEPERIYPLYPHQLSGGMQQRALIAMALAGRPRLLIADEATRSLDATTQVAILALLRELQLQLGMALVVITHDLRLASSMADDVLVMRRGKRVEYGTVETVFRAPAAAYTRELLDAVSAPLPADGGKSVKASCGQSGSAIASLASVTTTPLLRLANVSQRYSVPPGWIGHARTVTVLSNVTLDIHDGETLALIGQTGSGKTSLARTLLQEPPPTAGIVEFQGVALTGLNRRAVRKVRREIQMIFQDPFASLDPKWRILAIVEEPLIRATGVSRIERRLRAQEALDLVGLPHTEFGQRKPRSLSGGECQRVAIARALAVRPKLLILDEALSSLDPLTQSSILALLQRLRTTLNIALLMISHDLTQVARICDRVAVIDAGRLCEIGPVATVFRSPSHACTASLLEALRERKHLRAADHRGPGAAKAATDQRHSRLGAVGA
jgi:peptide/nickel transport system ATP-binding protein